MKYDEFLARVRERGEYKDNDEAAHVTNAVLEVLAQRISPGEVRDLASQLPGPLGQVLVNAAPQQARAAGELNQIISQLPSSYAALFGKADLAG